MPRRPQLRALASFSLLAAALLLPRLCAARPQEVVDRIIARIEDDIITLSEMKQLAAYQQLVEGRSETSDRLLSELIEQWVVNGEATAAQFPQPANSEVDREVARFESAVSGSQAIPGGTPPQAYLQKLATLELTPETVRRMVTQEIFLARYLDYKFRPSVQVDDAAIQNYYDRELKPALLAKNQPVPSLDDVREEIREILVQRGINDRASSWFEETKSRLNIEVEPSAGIGSEAPVGSGAGASSGAAVHE